MGKSLRRGEPPGGVGVEPPELLEPLQQVLPELQQEVGEQHPDVVAEERDPVPRDDPVPARSSSRRPSGPWISRRVWRLTSVSDGVGGRYGVGIVLCV